MDHDQFLLKLAQLIDEVKVGVLTSLDHSAQPHIRWMTPGLLPNYPNVLYAVSGPHFEWVKALEQYPNVEWMVQNKALTEVLRISGKMQVIDNPSLKAEVLQAVGRNISVFWKVNMMETNLVVVETILEKGYYFLPMQGKRVYVEFPHTPDTKRSDWV